MRPKHSLAMMISLVIVVTVLVYQGYLGGTQVFSAM